MSSPVLAVDFGTSYSSAVVVLGERLVPVKEPHTHSYSFSSAVCRQGERLLVGDPAERRKHRDPVNYRAEFKREFGEDVPIDLGGERYAVTDLVAEVMTALRVQAERVANQPIMDGVLTVPAGYGPLQRELMGTVAQRARFTGRVHLLEEPVAAAFAPAHGPEPRRDVPVLVYDFGGGTFDAALLSPGAHGFEVIAHTGLPFCGGSDADRLVYAELVSDGGEEFKDLLSPGPDADPNDHERARYHQHALLDYARNLKHQLSDVPAVDDVYVAGPLSFPVCFDRERLRRLIDPLLRQTVDCCNDLVRGAGYEPADLAVVLLVGGMTRMPLVVDTVAHEISGSLRYTEDPELAVAYGAAQWAADHAGEPAPPAGLAEPEPGRGLTVISAPAPLTSVAVSSKTLMCVTGETDGLVRLWDLRDGSAGVTSSPYEVVVTSVDISRDGDVVVSGGPDGYVRSWVPASGEEQVVARHDGWVNAVRISADGRRVLSAGDDGTWRVSLVDGPHEEQHGDLVGTPATACAFCGTTEIIAVLGSNGCLLYGDHMLDRVGSARAFTADPTGQLIAIGCTDGEVRLFKPPGTDPVATYSAGQGAVRDLAFSPSGRLLVSCAGTEIRLWDIEGRGEAHVLGQHDGRARAAAFPREGLVVSAGADATLRLWHPTSSSEEESTASHPPTAHLQDSSPSGGRS